ncbi:MAG TPA: PadR family transcriptional regulator [Thermoanaerobaculia bacterium]|nr:PadR family transcriptional regulator [Thermoanaerobaculia bacterium]
MSPANDLLQGTLDLLVLRLLARGPMHGWAISQRLELVSDRVLQVPQGSLYPALHRLEAQGWIVASWGTSENKRRAKFYELTAAGRNMLARERTRWDRLSAAIDTVLEEA